MSLRRKNSIIIKNLQYQILFAVMASGVSIYLVSAFGLRILSSQIFEILELADVKGEVAISLMNSINRSATYLLGFTSICLIVTWISSLYLSNRIAGPIYKINQALDERLSGNKEVRIQIRKNDFFEDLVEKINTLFEKENPSA